MNGVINKTCTKCKELKPVDNFYRYKDSSDGFSCQCKSCKNAVSKEWIKNNPEKIKAKNKRLNKKLYKWKREQETPEQKKAWKSIQNAVYYGSLKRQPCIKCGRKENIQAHHPDYSKPRDVIWLCQPCHKKEHKRLRQCVGA